jgi:hypothetical protein
MKTIPLNDYYVDDDIESTKKDKKDKNVKKPVKPKKRLIDNYDNF